MKVHSCVPHVEKLLSPCYMRRDARPVHVLGHHATESLSATHNVFFTNPAPPSHNVLSPGALALGLQVRSGGGGSERAGGWQRIRTEGRGRDGPCTASDLGECEREERSEALLLGCYVMAMAVAPPTSCSLASISCLLVATRQPPTAPA